MVAVSFDVRRLEVKGSPAVIVEGVRGSAPTGAMQFALSSVRTAAYVPDPLTLNRTLVWVDRRGAETPILSAGSRPFAQPRISPDGARVAMEIGGQDQAIWIWEFTRGTLTRLTFGRSLDLQPRWAADGRRILYSSGYSEDRGVFWKATDGTGAAERLTRGNDARQPRSVTPDGKWMLVAGSSAATAFDLNVVPLEGDHRTQPLLRGPSNEVNGEISPDGRWIAYQSDESGRTEIYVRPFPDVDMGRWQVSAAGGLAPRWSREGRELFFLDIKQHADGGSRSRRRSDLHSGQADAAFLGSWIRCFVRCGAGRAVPHDQEWLVEPDPADHRRAELDRGVEGAGRVEVRSLPAAKVM
jgi:eukaryotic-like serine/threonine-protein kinase